MAVMEDVGRKRISLMNHGSLLRRAPVKILERVTEYIVLKLLCVSYFGGVFIRCIGEKFLLFMTAP